MNKLLLITVVTLLVTLIRADVPIPFSDCGSQHAKISLATCSQWPPSLGASWSFTIEGSVDETVSSGNYDAIIYFDGIKLFEFTGTLASIGINGIPAGPFTIQKTVNIPSLPISGDIKVHASATDQNSQSLICVEVSATISSPQVNQRQNLFDEINSAQSSWKAGSNAFFNGWTVEDTKALLGVKKNDNLVLPRKFYSDLNAPAEYDARDSGCVGPVLNQGDCGSCWAFGAAEAISDRTCMKTGTFLQLAPLDLVTCDENDGGCEGGDPGSAWTYAQTNGLVTESCLPYLTSEGGPIPTCPPSQQPCLNFVDTPDCNTTCANGASYQSDKHFVSSVYGVSGIDQIEQEISLFGPVEAAFTVYEDFLSYKSGVYYYQSGQELGGHAVKMIGYGTENGVDYWLCQNSWTTSWGDNGYFKIRKGTDECGIEDDIVAGLI